MVAMLSVSSAGPYIPDIPMHPRARGKTLGPAEPKHRNAPSFSQVMPQLYSFVSAASSSERRGPRPVRIRVFAFRLREKRQPRGFLLGFVLICLLLCFGPQGLS